MNLIKLKRVTAHILIIYKSISDCRLELCNRNILYQGCLKNLLGLYELN